MRAGGSGKDHLCDQQDELQERAQQQLKQERNSKVKNAKRKDVIPSEAEVVVVPKAVLNEEDDDEEDDDEDDDDIGNGKFTRCKLTLIIMHLSIAI